MKYTIEITDAEDSILIPYAQSQNSSVAAMIVINGKENMIQGALRAYCRKAVSTGAVDQSIISALVKDENAIWSAVHADWQGKKAFAGIIAAVLTGEVVAAKAAA